MAVGSVHVTIAVAEPESVVTTRSSDRFCMTGAVRSEREKKLTRLVSRINHYLFPPFHLAVLAESIELLHLPKHTNPVQSSVRPIYV